MLKFVKITFNMDPVFNKFFSRIDSFNPNQKRKKRLDNIASVINENLNKTRSIVFLCTHNSRRSQICEVWGKVFAEIYRKKININSSPIFFGTDIQKAIMLFYSLFVLIVMLLAIQNNFKLMFIGVLFLLYQGYFQNKLSQEGKNLEAFKSNSHVGLVIAIILFMENQSGLYS